MLLIYPESPHQLTMFFRTITIVFCVLFILFCFNKKKVNTQQLVLQTVTSQRRLRLFGEKLIAL